MTTNGWAPAHTMLLGERTPSVAEEQTVAEVHELVRAWRAGLSIENVRQVCSGHDRWTAVRFTATQHTMWDPLMAMLDALIASDTSSEHGRMYQTPQGTFSEAELTHREARITKTTDGRLRILFPHTHPWRVKPDPERGIEGVRDAPRYAETYDERYRIANEKHVAKAPRRTFE